MNEIEITLKFEMDFYKWCGLEIPFGLYGLLIT